MAGILYDYLVGMTIMGVIFVSAVFVVPQMSYVSLFNLSQQQLRNIATQTLKAIVLQTGYPTDWGTAYPFDPDSVEMFGLAESSSSSFYVLDPDKVQRLVTSNPIGYIEYSDMKELLGLEDYGFCISIIAPFKVIVNDRDFDGESNPVTLGNLTEGVEVFIVHNSGGPIPQALVEATLVYVLKNDKDQFYIVKASNITNAVGKCIIESDIPQGPDEISDFIMVFKVTVAEVTSVTSAYMEGFDQQHVMNGGIIGENITLAIPEGPGWESGSKGTRWVDNVVLVSEDAVRNLYNGTHSNEDKITWGEGYWGWSRQFSGLSYYNPLFFIINLNVPNPRRLVLFLGPEPFWLGSKVLHYGGMPESSDSSVKIQRNVVISGMVYTIELTMWRGAS